MGEDTAPDGVSEFFADELALTLNCARASATTLTEHALTLTQTITATLAVLAAGELDWPRARTFAEELGWPARDTDPALIAEVEAAVLPEAAGMSIRRLKERLRRELTARDAAASDRRREKAHRAVNVTRRSVGDGVSELVAGMPDELAAACQAAIDQLAWRAKKGGDDRPIGMLRSGILADLVLRPWLVPDPVAGTSRSRCPSARSPPTGSSPPAPHCRRRSRGPAASPSPPGRSRVRRSPPRTCATCSPSSTPSACTRPRTGRSASPSPTTPAHCRPWRPARTAAGGAPGLLHPPGRGLRLCGHHPPGADHRLQPHRAAGPVPHHPGSHLPPSRLRQPRRLGRRRPRHPARRRRRHRLCQCCAACAAATTGSRPSRRAGPTP
ncbi:DUF222 domain-containing protein [Geodermatophilus chilensis]|uniref:DUF222 domain-containing protein n=1 Tax=Geodermatophilus chilensis TaxID=2035835 RepID=UPI000C264005